METALAFVCSLLLIWAPFVQWSAQAVSEGRPARTCCAVATAARPGWCATQSSPEPSLVSAVPLSF